MVRQNKTDIVEQNLINKQEYIRTCENTYVQREHKYIEREHKIKFYISELPKRGTDTKL